MNLSGKIDESLLTVFYDVSQVAASLDIPFFVIGATARDLVMNYGFGIKPGRATRDLDLGVRIANWKEFQALTNGLVASQKFKPSAATQRFFHTRSTLPVDIVPFGEIAAGGATISWPPKHVVELNIIGFDEAYEHAWSVRLSDNLIIRLASPIGLTLLKIISWNDRDCSTRIKDAQDLAMILRNYSDTGNIDRLFDKERALLEVEDHDYENAGARLLGRDLASIANPKTVQSLLAILDGETQSQSQYRLIADMRASRIDAGKFFKHHLNLLKKLKQGISEVVNGDD